MIDKDGTSSGRFRGGVEGAFKRSKDVGDVFVEVTYLTCGFSDEFSLIMWKMSQGLRSFGVLDLG